MQHLGVIFTRSRHPGSLAIRAFTWSRWSHVGVILDDDLVIDSTLEYGVSVTRLKDFTSLYPQWHICKLPCRDKTLAHRFLRSQLGKPYDWTAIAGIAIRRDWQEPDSWFCSELVAASTGLFRHDYVRRITPEDLWRISEDS